MEHIRDYASEPPTEIASSRARPRAEPIATLTPDHRPGGSAGVQPGFQPAAATHRSLELLQSLFQADSTAPHRTDGRPTASMRGDNLEDDNPRAPVVVHADGSWQAESEAHSRTMADATMALGEAMHAGVSLDPEALAIVLSGNEWLPDVWPA